MSTFNGYKIRISGTVQGVGFRPFIWQLAQQGHYLGNVYNDERGVVINLFNHAQASTININEFIASIYQQRPDIAVIDSLSFEQMSSTHCPTSFSITESQGSVMQTQISPDINTCETCRGELLTPTNRRFNYPFINCTHCGPRFSIINAMPYDRKHTSMAKFSLCSDCQQEYDDPSDRRFHAQPTACAACGPTVWLTDRQGNKQDINDSIAELAKILQQGQIVAIKGVGGFHLACDASNEATVKRLRARKQRPDKPFAILATFKQSQQLVELSEQEKSLLQANWGPLVLLNKKPHTDVDDTMAPNANARVHLAASVAPSQPSLAVMLPSNPIQILLMEQMNFPLVMTSGNASGNAPCIDNQQALVELGNIADYFLLHNRDIVNRVDDSIVRWLGFSCEEDNSLGQLQTLRRARGLVPQALALPKALTYSQDQAGQAMTNGIVAMGADIKNTFCIVKDTHAQISQHLGDLANPNIFREYQQQLQRYLTLFALTPEHIIADQHQDYYSTRFSDKFAEQFTTIEGQNVRTVQHHHAHAVAVLGEHNITLAETPVLALVLDGLGFAQQNSSAHASHSLWGGELLRVKYDSFEHVWGLPAVALPGGNIASKQPWRNLMAHLHVYQQHQKKSEAPSPKKHPQQPRALAPYFTHHQQQLWQVLDKKLNCPPASSAGRLFDAVAALLDLTPEHISYEGQAAIALENCARKAVKHDEQKITTSKFTLARFDHQKLWQQLLIEREKYTSAEQQDLSTSKANAAFAFHQLFADMLLGEVAHAQQNYPSKYLVLCGGVCQNSLLLALFYQGIKQINRQTSQQIHLLLPNKLPANDGGLSFGQALIGCAKYA